MSRAGSGPSARGLVLSIVLLCFIGASLTAEWRSLIRPDTGFLLDAAARILGGERLYVDVVEINPPLIVWLNMGAVALPRSIGASPIVVYCLGVIGVLVGSLLVTAMLLRRLLPDAPRLAACMVVLLAFVLFPLSAQDFGEREHLVLALLIPYLLLAAARWEGRPIQHSAAALIGAGAAIAFALKPHFLLVGIGLELWLRWRTDRRWRPLAPESIAILVLLAVYGVAIVALTPAYFGLVALLAGPYNRFLHEGVLQLLIMGPGAVLVLFALLTWLAGRIGAPDAELLMRLLEDDDRERQLSALSVSLADANRAFSHYRW